MNFEHILSFSGLLSLLTLAIMEIVLGIDNVIFISILSDRIDPRIQDKVRKMGILLALVVRLALLALLVHMTKLEFTLFTIMGNAFAIKHIILIAGGVFLIYKSTTEIHECLEGHEEEIEEGKKKLSPANAIFQIIMIDIVFSFDSILTAVGLSDELFIMILAVLISMTFMLMSSKSIANFINAHPTIKMLALSFLMTIGVILVSEGLHIEIPKGYVYYSLGFSIIVELLNLRMKKKSKKPVKLRVRRRLLD